MPDTHTTSVDQQRLEKERIEDDGTFYAELWI